MFEWVSLHALDLSSPCFHCFSVFAKCVICNTFWGCVLSVLHSNCIIQVPDGGSLVSGFCTLIFTKMNIMGVCVLFLYVFLWLSGFRSLQVFLSMFRANITVSQLRRHYRLLIWVAPGGDYHNLHLFLGVLYRWLFSRGRLGNLVN